LIETHNVEVHYHQIVVAPHPNPTALMKIDDSTRHLAPPDRTKTITASRRNAGSDDQAEAISDTSGGNCCPTCVPPPISSIVFPRDFDDSE
jgi:hypothetical protein